MLESPESYTHKIRKAERSKKLFYYRFCVVLEESINENVYIAVNAITSISKILYSDISVAQIVNGEIISIIGRYIGRKSNVHDPWESTRDGGHPSVDV